MKTIHSFFVQINKYKKIWWHSKVKKAQKCPLDALKLTNILPSVALYINIPLWNFFHIVMPTQQSLFSETYFINFNAWNEFLCLQCQFQCLKWILVLTMLPISIVPTGQFFVVRMIHEASRLSHLSPQFIKKNPSNF